MNVLISAFACAPGQGSESGVGWNWALQAARFHDVWVLTAEGQRPEIEAQLTSHPVPHLQFIYFDVPKWAYWFKREGPSHKPYYYIWQLFALRAANAAHKKVHFDLIHHLTYNTIDVPGFLWLLGTKFVWGPVGGGQIPPRALHRYFRRHWVIEEARAVRKHLLHLAPVVRLAIARADLILAANRDTETLLRSLGATRVTRLLEAGCPHPPVAGTYRRRDHDAITILWAGVLFYRKAPLLALEAFAALIHQGVEARLVIAGDGPLKERLAADVARLALQPWVSLPGRVSREEMNRLYCEADIFLFTSLSDTSGNVVLEAMSARLPIVALDHQGVAEMVSEETGILVPVHSVEQVRRDLAMAIERLARDATLRRRMGERAHDRVARLYTWDQKGDMLKGIYAQFASHAP